jgi:hypothetical protein
VCLTGRAASSAQNGSKEGRAASERFPHEVGGVRSSADYVSARLVRTPASILRRRPRIFVPLLSVGHLLLTASMID